MKFRLTKKPELVDGIEIQGGTDFCVRTKEALELLRPSCLFREVQPYIAVIKQGKRSGIWARARKPTFVVGEPTWRHSALWYAGAIAHDAYHSKLYHEAKMTEGGKEPNSDAWTGREAEKKCLAFQRRVVEEIKAGDPLIAYLQDCEKDPVYQGRSNRWWGWMDYARRWW